MAGLIALFLAAAGAWALVELLRKPVNARTRRAAPGRFANLSRGPTHYRWHGEENGPAAILVHGLTTPSFVWNAMIPGLTRAGFRVLSYDLYGRGYSARPLGRQTPALFTQQLDELIAAEGFTRPVTLVGYSMGGLIAADWAAQHPERVARLILIAPAGFRYVPDGFLRFCARVPVLGDWLFTVLGGYYGRRLARTVGAGSVIPEMGRNLERMTRFRGFLQAVLSSERHTLGTDMTDGHRALAAARVPVLAVWGAADPVIPPGNAATLGAANPAAVQTEIPGAGHGLVYTHPKAVLGAIRTFLRDTA